MNAIAQSVLVGAAGVWAALLAAVFIATTRRSRPDTLKAAATLMLLVLALQTAHFIEEFSTGFHRQFFPLLGQAAWPDTLFIAFNVVWIIAWSVAAAAAFLGRWPWLSGALFWFLGLAAVFNGVAHPVLALLNSGYFPGLATAPLLGIAGFLLLRRLGAEAAPLTGG